MRFVDHVALLVPDLESALSTITRLGLEHGEIEDFPAEGTREVYVGEPGQQGRLLLMQPLGDGPYQRALSKRGPGLHHVAIGVADLSAFLSRDASGWLLHPHSVESISSCSTTWLARPGVGTLVEVVEADANRQPPQQAPLVSRVEVAVQPALVKLLPCLTSDGTQIDASPDDGSWLTIRGQRLCASTLSTSFDGQVQGSFANADLMGADLARASLGGADFTGADITCADLTGADLEAADFADADLTASHLTCATLTGANLSGANLTGAELTCASMTDANLTGANLMGANLTGASLMRSVFEDANLQEANLTGAKLMGAKLAGATLTGANLRGANLTDVDLTDVDLTDVDLTGADLP